MGLNRNGGEIRCLQAASGPRANGLAGEAKRWEWKAGQEPSWLEMRSWVIRKSWAAPAGTKESWAVTTVLSAHAPGQTRLEALAPGKGSIWSLSKEMARRSWWAPAPRPQWARAHVSCTHYTKVANFPRKPSLDNLALIVMFRVRVIERVIFYRLVL